MGIEARDWADLGWVLEVDREKAAVDATRREVSVDFAVNIFLEGCQENTFLQLSYLIFMYLCSVMR
jgi:hypothetical protein